MSDKKPIAEYTLPKSGKKVEVFEGKGRHFERAMLIAKGDQRKLIACLAAEISTFDGEKITGGQVSEMGLKDYLVVLQKTAEALEIEEESGNLA